MRFTFHLAAVVAALSGTAVAAAQKASTGNGAPSGPHFNLNIIGVSHDKNPNMNGNGSGNVIFVDLGTRTGDAVTTKILLSQAADGVFDVLDKNGGSPAELACGTPTVSLFATCLQDFLWQYDNNGLKLLQVRFYPS